MVSHRGVSVTHRCQIPSLPPSTRQQSAHRTGYFVDRDHLTATQTKPHPHYQCFQLLFGYYHRFPLRAENVHSLLSGPTWLGQQVHDAPSDAVRWRPSVDCLM